MAAIVAAALLLLRIEMVCAGEAETTATVAVIAVHWGSGDWALRIQANQIVRAIVVGDKGARRTPRALSKPERERLALLVGKLPRDRPLYSFGKTAPDVTVEFGLSVGVGAEERKYNVGELLEETDYGPELRAILETLQFLHTLVGSERALPPPPLIWRASKE